MGALYKNIKPFSENWKNLDHRIVSPVLNSSVENKDDRCLHLILGFIYNLQPLEAFINNASSNRTPITKVVQKDK